MAGKTKTWFFDGRHRTLREIGAHYFAGVPLETLRCRLNNSKASSVAAMREFLSAPSKKQVVVEESKTAHNFICASKKDPEPRFSREVRKKADAVIGAKGCNYCHRQKPLAELSPITRGSGAYIRKGFICDTCKKNQTRRSTNK